MKPKYVFKTISIIFVALIAAVACSKHENINQTHNKSICIPMHLLNNNKSIGYIEAKKVSNGVLFTPHLSNLPAGMHGFHIHVNPSCNNKGMAAGGHWDPNSTGKHLGPYNNNGHLGDLPILIVNKNQTATIPILAKRFNSLSELKGHSLMIHAGSDNYSDSPKKLGGGGARIACGVIT